jgi:cytochrome d ubiquinol oxidase subunit II
MGLIWFWLVAVMLSAYVILDGFDLGVGALYPFLARTEDERAMMIRAIGPVWDGNEVWLLAGGGTLYFAFPLLYASAFSGFYLPLMIVLWLLILRGIGLELRSHVDAGVWRDLLGGVFAFASTLLPVFFGAALANVIRGVPLSQDGYFFLPLWTDFRVGVNPGILDWYTVIGGLVALIALLIHGALWISVKTSGMLELRARSAVTRLWWVLILLTPISLVATMAVRRATLDNYLAHPISFLIPAIVVIALLGIWYFNRIGQALNGFFSSCTYLLFMLVGAAFGLYPTLLPSVTPNTTGLTVARCISGMHTLSVGLVWWGVGMILALGYFVLVYSMFRGKVHMSPHE